MQIYLEETRCFAFSPDKSIPEYHSSERTFNVFDILFNCYVCLYNYNMVATSVMAMALMVLIGRNRRKRKRGGRLLFALFKYHYIRLELFIIYV